MMLRPLLFSAAAVLLTACGPKSMTSTPETSTPSPMASPTAAPTAVFSLPRWRWPALLPSAEGLRRSWYASYEWLGLGWYRLRAGQAMRSPTP